MRILEGDVAVSDVDAFVERLDGVGAEYDCAVQAFDARYVAGRSHVESAVRHANRAFDRGENVARERAVEIMLYAAGRRQINRAVEMGVSEGETAAVLVVDGDDEDGAVDALRDLDAFVTQRPTLDEGDGSVLAEFFDVTDAEREASRASLADLVCERVALLDVEK